MLPTRSTDPSATSSEPLAARAGRLAEKYVPAYVVVDDADTVVLYSGGTAQFLEPAGPASLNLFSLVHPTIASELQALLRWSRMTGRAGRSEALAATLRGAPSLLTLLVEPMPAMPDEPRRMMVLFRDDGPTYAQQPADQRRLVDQLQVELRLARASLTSTRHELSTSNEEYRSSAEELEATNEELEVTFEELRLVNAELAGRLDELDRVNIDIRHMLESTQIAIVFLDGTLRIRSFTPAVHDLFHLIEADRGRRISEIAAHIVYPALEADVSQVFRSCRPVEREIAGVGGVRRYLVRVLPYRNSEESAAGVVLAFIDVTAAHHANLARRETEERLNRIAASVPAFLFIASGKCEWDYVNPPFYAFTGMPEGHALGTGWHTGVHPDDWEVMERMWQEASAVSATLEHEIRFLRDDGEWCWFLIRTVPQLDARGHVVRWFGSCTDIDRRRQAERRQGLALAELQHRVKNILAVVRSLLLRTLSSSTDLDHFAEHFAGRIGALARCQTVAARTPERFVMLEELVVEELAAHGGQDENQTHVNGPSVALSETVAGAIGLALHELTTNALKYGALSIPAGRVQVRWRLEAQRHVALEWYESGVPLTDLNPKRRGFGRDLIEHGLPGEIGATTTLAFRPGGLYCRIAFSLPAQP